MEIRTRRLVLREFTVDDWPDVLAYERDARYWRYSTGMERTDNDVRAFVEAIVALQQEQPRRKFRLAITLAGDDTVIGSCAVRRKDGTEFEADIGYDLHPEYWGRGYATEAARAMIACGFEELGVHRISAWCIAEDIASVRVLEKAGLRREGCLRENEHFKDRWWDTLLFGILRDERVALK
jgi:[ribosomal protein S5]-alanine N-acetyltransferase